MCAIIMCRIKKHLNVNINSIIISLYHYDDNKALKVRGIKLHEAYYHITRTNTKRYYSRFILTVHCQCGIVSIVDVEAFKVY